MCSRLQLQVTEEQLRAMHSGLLDIAGLIPQNPNAAPTDQAAIIALNPEGYWKVRPAIFGLVPHWSKAPEDIKGRFFNARLETADTLKTFKAAYEKRHCLIPCTGFYEWKTEDGLKQPYLIQRSDHDPLMLAGLWERWKSKDDNGKEIYSFTILTTEPNSFMERYHNRMPVMMSENNYEPWLANEVGKENIEFLPSDMLKASQVDKAMNNQKK